MNRDEGEPVVPVSERKEQSYGGNPGHRELQHNAVVDREIIRSINFGRLKQLLRHCRADEIFHQDNEEWRHQARENECGVRIREMKYFVIIMYQAQAPRQTGW